MRIHTVRTDWKSLICWKNIPTFTCSCYFTQHSYSKLKKELKKSAKPTLFLPRPTSVTSTQILAEHNCTFPILKWHIPDFNEKLIFVFSIKIIYQNGLQSDQDMRGGGGLNLWRNILRGGVTFKPPPNGDIKLSFCPFTSFTKFLFTLSLQNMLLVLSN